MARSEKDMKILVERVPDYRALPTSGFGIARMESGQVVLEPFFDLPPFEENPDTEVVCIKRQLWGCFTLSRAQAKDLAEALLQILSETEGASDERE